MTITERLTKANDLLLCLDKQKSTIEQRIEKALESICKVDEKIGRTECELEKVAEEKMSREQRDKVWCEITKLKKEKKSAEKHLDCYRKKLKEKFRRFKKLSDSLK